MSTWRGALLDQARSDFSSSEALLALGDAHASQTTMLLQMAWEKLAKAALVSGGQWNPKTRIHKVAATGGAPGGANRVRGRMRALGFSAGAALFPFGRPELPPARLQVRVLALGAPGSSA